MAWNRNIFANFGVLSGVVLSLFFGMAVVSCAGTDSSAQKKGKEKANLFKTGTPIADTLASRVEFARSVFKGIFDSVPGEYYYYATDGKIDTLFQKEGELYKAVATIDYDSLKGLDLYEIKKGNHEYLVKNGVLVAENVSPGYSKEYWDNGNIKGIAKGKFYKDDQGNSALDSGHLEMYFENGKIQQQSDVIDKRIVVGKEWSENGVLIKEIEFPKYFKEYWDNGKFKEILIGIIYTNDQGYLTLDSGRDEIYFENGEIQRQTDWKNKQLVAQKEWNENGVLIKDFDISKYIKEYWDNGNPKEVLTGILYRDDQDVVRLDSGHSELYFENGKNYQQNDWKNKQLIAQKEWNESGSLIREFEFPKYAKDYWDNGKIRQTAAGLLYRTDYGDIQVDSGRSEIYFDNGKIKERNDWKDKQGVASKQWNEKGGLIREFEFPKYVKEFWDNGKLKKILTGILYRDNHGVIQADSGRLEMFFENGKIKERTDWKDKEVVVSKGWNEKGVLIQDVVFPQYAKAYWDNGKPREILIGLLYRDEYGVLALDSGHSDIYFENGKIKERNDWKNKQPSISKTWNEKGTLIREIDFPKSYKEYWDNGKPKGVMTGLIYRDEQGNFYLDSGHAEIYFENGKIQQKNDRKNKLLVTQKDWNENGVLTKDVDFPQYYKEYWDDGKPKAILTGRLYRKNQDNFALDSGHLEFYFENGKIKEQSDWKNKLLFANKQWNENGVLINELDFPKSIKEYWDNGNPKAIGIGLFYKDDQGFVWMDRGHSETYFENGKIKGKSDSKDKQVVASKTWNENGVLKKELVFPKYEKKYSDNETLIKELEGTLYYDDQKNVQVQDGFRKEYYDNGKNALHIIYKGKEIVSKTVWNENGVVTISVELPNRYKEFYDDGKIKADVTGTVVEEDDAFKIKDGVYNMYDPNGKVTYSATFKDFQVISEK